MGLPVVAVIIPPLLIVGFQAFPSSPIKMGTVAATAPSVREYRWHCDDDGWGCRRHRAHLYRAGRERLEPDDQQRRDYHGHHGERDVFHRSSRFYSGCEWIVLDVLCGYGQSRESHDERGPSGTLSLSQRGAELDADNLNRSIGYFESTGTDDDTTAHVIGRELYGTF